MIYFTDVYKRGIIFLLPIFMFSVGNGECSENQLWTKDSIGIRIDDKWSIGFQGALRWEKGTTRLFERHLQFYVHYDFCSSWNIVPSYRQNEKREKVANGKSKWKSSQEPIMDLVKIWDTTCIKISDRNRFHYKSLDKTWFYRNRLEIAQTFKCKSFKFTPFLSEEIFFKSFREYCQNRWEIGIRVSVSQRIESAISYMQQHEKNENSWNLKQIWNIDLKYSFYTQ